MIEKILAIHRSLDAARIPHAFGGALALAWCTREPRTTVDVDVNVFLPPIGSRRCWPHFRRRSPGGRPSYACSAGRLAWDATPVDLFLNTAEFHVAVAGRCRRQPLAGVDLPFLSCPDPAVFKAFFSREKDWLDLANMAEAGSLDVAALEDTIAEYLGLDDTRLGRIRKLPGL